MTPTECCPVCDASPLEPVLELVGAPVLCGALWPTRQAALGAPTGTITLAICPSCATAVNTTFDPALVEYGPGYDNSLHGSPVFREYAESLARRLVDRFDLHGKHVVEIGCGKGEFLEVMCRTGGNVGTGFDPAVGRPVDSPAGVTLVPELFGEDTPVDADFVCARHVVEHLPDPVRVLGAVAGAARGMPLALYVEVPDARTVFGGASLWDVIYPHVAYYGPAGLRRLLGRCGFDVLETGTSFGDQFLYADAIACGPSATTGRPDDIDFDDDVATVRNLARAFGHRYRGVRDEWSRRLDELAAEDARVVVWGAGAKTCAFLNAVEPADAVRFVVDVNPRKQGRFVPGTGHPVRGPAALATSPVDVVLVMNPQYHEEVVRDLAEAGVAATVTLV
jgi:hypothetical protein